MKTNLGLKTSQQLALTPQLQQSIKLLQMSTVELREELESTILENPLLEFEESTVAPQIQDQQDTKLIDKGVVINRPPRDGRMAFIKSPNNISIEILQQGEALEIKNPWKSMENTGTW